MSLQNFLLVHNSLEEEVAIAEKGRGNDFGWLMCKNTEVAKAGPAWSIPSSGLFPGLCLLGLQRTSSYGRREEAAVGGEESAKEEVLRGNELFLENVFRSICRNSSGHDTIYLKSTYM